MQQRQFTPDQIARMNAAEEIITELLGDLTTAGESLVLGPFVIMPREDALKLLNFAQMFGAVTVDQTAVEQETLQ